MVGQLWIHGWLHLQEHKERATLSEIDAKVKYTALARSLKTYGITFFLVKVSTSPLRSSLTVVVHYPERHWPMRRSHWNPPHCWPLFEDGKCLIGKDLRRDRENAQWVLVVTENWVEVAQLARAVWGGCMYMTLIYLLPVKCSCFLSYFLSFLQTVSLWCIQYVI